MRAAIEVTRPWSPAARSACRRGPPHPGALYPVAAGRRAGSPGSCCARMRVAAFAPRATRVERTRRWTAGCSARWRLVRARRRSARAHLGDGSSPALAHHHTCSRHGGSSSDGGSVCAFVGRLTLGAGQSPPARFSHRVDHAGAAHLGHQMTVAGGRASAGSFRAIRPARASVLTAGNLGCRRRSSRSHHHAIGGVAS